MIIRHHIHYTISPARQVTKQHSSFDPPVEIESPVTVDGPWFALNQHAAVARLQVAGDDPARPASMQAPRVMKDDQLHVEDTASAVSIAVPKGFVLQDIDPGTVNKAEVDLTLLRQINADQSVSRQLCFLFINPRPADPVPFNIDAMLTVDKHNYVKRLQDTPERLYHKLLLRHCLVAGYQVWPDVMTLEMAAAYCQVAKSTMATWVKDGWIKASPGTKPRILKANLDTYLESR